MLVLTDKFENEWIFFIDEENNFCYKTKNQSQILLNKCTDEFDCSFSENGDIHAVIQNTEGEIIYIKYNGEIWQKYVILKNKFNRQNFSNIILNAKNEFPELFYTIFHNYRFYLIRHKIDICKNTKPKVIDYCLDGNFSISFDSLNNAHITYKNESELPIYKICNLQTDEIKNMNFDIPSNAKNLVSLWNNNSLNVVYIIRFKQHYTISYKNLTNNFEHTLGFGRDSLCIPHIFSSDNNINIIWSERFAHYKVVSNNNGKSFSKIQFLGNAPNFIRFKDFNSHSTEYKIKNTY